MTESLSSAGVEHESCRLGWLSPGFVPEAGVLWFMEVRAITSFTVLGGLFLITVSCSSQKLEAFK